MCEFKTPVCHLWSQNGTRVFSIG